MRNPFRLEQRHLVRVRVRVRVKVRVRVRVGVRVQVRLRARVRVRHDAGVTLLALRLRASTSFFSLCSVVGDYVRGSLIERVRRQQGITSYGERASCYELTF